MTEVATPVVPAEETPSSIDPKLLEQIEALKALSTTHGLLHRGHFQYVDVELLPHSILFIKALHENLLKEALANPDASKVEELKARMPAEAETNAES